MPGIGPVGIQHNIAKDMFSLGIPPGRIFSAHQLEKQHTKAKRVDGSSQMAAAHVVLGKISLSAVNFANGYVRRVSFQFRRQSTSQAKIANFRFKMAIQQNVAAFDVAVYDVIGMEVAQSPGSSQCNVGPGDPT